MIQAQSAVSVAAAVPQNKNTSTARNKPTATRSPSSSSSNTATKVQAQVNPINLNLTQEQELALLDTVIQISIVSHSQSKAAFERAKSLIAQYNQLATQPYSLPDFSVILALKAQYGGIWAAYYHKTLSTPPTSSSLPSSRSPLDASTSPAAIPTRFSNREHGGSGTVEEFQEASGKVDGDGERKGDYPSPRPAITTSRGVKYVVVQPVSAQDQQLLAPRLAQADLEHNRDKGKDKEDKISPATGHCYEQQPTTSTSSSTSVATGKLRKYLSTQPRLVLDPSNVATPAKEYVNGVIAEELWSLIAATYGEQARYLLHFATQSVSNNNTVPAGAGPGPTIYTFCSTVPASAGVPPTPNSVSERIRPDDLSGPMLITCTRIVSIYLALWDCPLFLRWATTTSQERSQGDDEVNLSRVFATLGVRRLQALLQVGTSHLTRCLAWLESHVFAVGKVQPARLALASRQQTELDQQLSFDLLDLRGQDLGRADDSVTLTSTLTSTSTSSGDTTSVIKSGTTSDPALLSSATLLKSGTAGSVTTTTTSVTAGARAILEAAIPATAAVEAKAKAKARVSKRNTTTLLNTHISDVSPLELEILYSDYQRLLAILSGTPVGQSQTQILQLGGEDDNEYVISFKKRRVGRTIQTSNRFYGLREEFAALLDHYPKSGSLGPVITPQQFAWLYSGGSVGITSNSRSLRADRRRRKGIKAVALSAEQSDTTFSNNSKHRPTSSVSLPAPARQESVARITTQEDEEEVATQERVALVSGLSREVTLRLQVGRRSSVTPVRSVSLSKPVTLKTLKVVPPLCSPVTLKTLKVVPLCEVVTLEKSKVENVNSCVDIDDYQF